MFNLRCKIDTLFLYPNIIIQGSILSFSQSNVYVYVFTQLTVCGSVCYVLMLTLYTIYIRQKYVSMLTVAILGCTIQKLTILIARGRNHLRLMNWKIAHAKYACSLCPINIVKHNCKSNKRNQSKTLHCEGYLYTNSVVYVSHVTWYYLYSSYGTLKTLNRSYIDMLHFECTRASLIIIFQRNISGSIMFRI